MYTVEFYETEDGNSELWTFLETLRKKAATSKDARIQYKQITFVLLHSFLKKTQKTPKRELDRAKAERADYLARKEREQNENVE